MLFLSDLSFQREQIADKDPKKYLQINVTLWYSQ